MSEQPQPPTDPHVAAAVAEEQELLRVASIEAQANYLLNRCVELSAQVKRLEAGRQRGLEIVPQPDSAP